MLPKLNFPAYEFRFKKNEKGVLMIFDNIRKKFVELTPEEWVRQNMVSYLNMQKYYPLSLFSIETAMKLNTTQKRTDIIIYNSEKKVTVLVECKAPNIKINTKVVEQVLRYNLVHQASFVILSNGIVHVFYEISEGKTKQISELPDFKHLTLNK